MVLGINDSMRVAKVPGTSVDHKSFEILHNSLVIFDSKMFLVPQVGAVCKSVLYYLHIIVRIRRFLTRQACELLVHALVTSRMDMYNALLTGPPSMSH